MKAQLVNKYSRYSIEKEFTWDPAFVRALLFQVSKSLCPTKIVSMSVVVFQFCSHSRPMPCCFSSGRNSGSAPVLDWPSSPLLARLRSGPYSRRRIGAARLGSAVLSQLPSGLFSSSGSPARSPQRRGIKLEAGGQADMSSVAFFRPR